MKIKQLHNTDTGKPVRMRDRNLDRDLLIEIGVFGSKDAETGKTEKYRVYQHANATYPYKKSKGKRKTVWKGDRLFFDPENLGDTAHSLYKRYGEGYFEISDKGGEVGMEYQKIWIEKERNGDK